jgi:hypothetical protein
VSLRSALRVVGLALSLERAGIPTVGIASTQDSETLEEAGAFVVAEDFTDPGLRGFLNR